MRLEVDPPIARLVDEEADTPEACLADDDTGGSEAGCKEPGISPLNSSATAVEIAASLLEGLTVIVTVGAYVTVTTLQALVAILSLTAALAEASCETAFLVSTAALEEESCPAAIWDEEAMLVASWLSTVTVTVRVK